MTSQIPYEMPSTLAELCGGELPRMIDAVTSQIQALPTLVRETLIARHLVQPSDLEYLPELASGLRHLHEGSTPTDAELETLYFARDIVAGVSQGVNDLIVEESLTPGEAGQCQQILSALKRVNDEVLPSEMEYARIQYWAGSYRDYVYPETPPKESAVLEP